MGVGYRSPYLSNPTSDVGERCTKSYADNGVCIDDIDDGITRPVPAFNAAFFSRFLRSWYINSALSATSLNLCASLPSTSIS